MLDKFQRRAAEGLSKASKEAQRQLTLAKLRLRLSEVSRQENDICTEVGRQFYAKVTAEQVSEELISDDLRALVDKLADLAREREEITRVIAEAESGSVTDPLVCPSCGALVPDGANFCPKCGAPLPK